MRVRLSINPLPARAFDLPDATREDPIVLGRERNLELQVASARVSRKHALFYQTPDGWVIENVSAREGTFVNGTKLTRPRLLGNGDRVHIADDPPAAVLLIDDLRNPTVAAPAATAKSAEPDADADMAEPTIDPALAAAVAPAQAAIRQRPPERRSMAPAVFSLIVTLLVTAGLGFAVRAYRAKQRQAAENDRAAEVERIIIKRPATQSITNSPVSSGPATVPANVKDFFQGDRPQTRPAAAPPPPAPIAPPPVVELPPDAMPAAPTEDPVRAAERATPAWQNIEELADAAMPTKAVWACEQYRINVPKTALADELARHAAAAMDSLWFERLGSIIAERKGFLDSIPRIRDEIKTVPKTFKDRIKQLQRQIDEANESARLCETLLAGELAYTGGTNINLSDDDTRAAIRNSRDPKRYEEWSTGVMARLRNTRGTSAW